MGSTLSSFAQSQAAPSALSIGSYPQDWSLFDTGDPAPGSPFDWVAIRSMWDNKAEALNVALSSFRATGELAGQGYKVRYLNESLSLGEDFISQVHKEFDRMAQLAQRWEQTLIDIKGRAQEAHRLATAAQDSVTEYSIKLAALTVSLNHIDDKSEREDTQKSIAGFATELSDAQRVLEAQREIVRGLAREYQTAGEGLRAEYKLTSVGDMIALAHTNHGVPNFALGTASGGSLFELSPDVIRGNPPVSASDLKLLSEKTAESPEALGEYLSSIALLSPAEIADFARRYPELAGLPVHVSNDGVGNAQASRDWWNVDGSNVYGLSEEQRAALIAQMPGFVGNLEGVRYSDRHQANMTLLNQKLEHPELLSDYAKDTLELIQKTINDQQKGAPRSLINLDLSNMDTTVRYDGFGKEHRKDKVETDDVLTTIAYGVLDRADVVTIFNPGMLNHPKTSLDPNDGDMAGMGQRIYNDQKEAYKKREEEATHAVVINLNYVTPQGLDVLSTHDAEIASERNANAVDALNVLGNNLSFEDDNRKIYLWNHSYGSTTAGFTLQKVNSPIEAYYNVAAAGWPELYFGDPDAMSFEYLGKDEQGHPQMYSTLADADNIARAGEYASGRFDPRAFKNSFTLSSEASADGQFGAVQGHPVNPADGTGYNSPGRTSYANGIFITTGNAGMIDSSEITFNADYPEWVYKQQGTRYEFTHKDFIMSRSK